MNPFAKLLLAILLITLFIGCVSRTSQRHVATTWQPKIDSIISGVPDFSGVVLIADKGIPVYYRAFGYKNFETREPLDTTDIFELASVSKQFTAMTIMMLKDEGKLSYDDFLEKFIPGLPYRGITIRHLLTHTSGLPDYQAIMDQYWDKSKVANNDDILTYLKKYHPPTLFSPGEKYTYSNTGYVMLGTIVEKVTGRDFIEYCRERIFNPLQMTSTDIRTPEQKKSIGNFALGHIYVTEKQRYVRADSFPSSNYTIWLGNRKGPGRMSSTASDLLKWDGALYSEKLIANPRLKEAFSPYSLTSDSLSNYGFGWMLEGNPDVGKIVWHNGDNPGYKTIIIRLIDQHKTIIILCNNAHPKFKEISEAVKHLLSY